MPGTVTSQITRVTAAESVDSANWDDIGGGPGSSQNADVVLQGSESRGRRVSGAVRGMSYDSGSTHNLSAANTHVGWWVQILQPGALSTDGAEFILGGGATPSTSPWSGWIGLTASTYPAAGGWVRVWLDPTRTRDFGAGTLDLAALRQFGVEFDMLSVGGNVQNCLIDSIGFTTGGLLVNAGTVISPATFQDFVTFDEGTSANRFGAVVTRDGVIFCLARLTIGNAVATVFNDSNRVLVFAKQPLVSATFMGVTVDLQAALTDIDWTNIVLRSGGTTNKGDFIVTGTLGSFVASSSTFDSLRALTLTSAVSLSNCVVNSSGLITAAGASLVGTRVLNSTAAAALLWNVATDPDGRLDSMAFVSAGTGHAIELGPNCPATISLRGQSYSGYGAAETTDAVLYNNSGKAITVNVLDGGATPTVRNGTGASTTVLNAVSVKVSVIDASVGSPISGARVYLIRDSDSQVVLNALTNGTGSVEDPAYNFTGDEPVSGYVRKGTGSPLYKESPLTGTIKSVGFDVTAPMVSDE